MGEVCDIEVHGRGTWQSYMVIVHGRGTSICIPPDLELAECWESDVK